MDPSLPAPPRTALIVPDTDPRVSYDVLDHDIAEIDTTTLQVTGYRSGLGTNLFALSHSPDGTLWAAASEARNLIRFEPALKGVFAESRIARLQAAGDAVVTDFARDGSSSRWFVRSGRPVNLEVPPATICRGPNENGRGTRAAFAAFGIPATNP